MVSGLFGKLRGLVPGSREVRRHYAAEVTVVVIGVLIALGADQAVRYVNDRIETAEARERIRLEVFLLLVNGTERIALDRCIKDRIGLLSDGLASGRSDWSAAVMPVSKRKAQRVLRHVYGIPNRNWVDDAYLEAQALGHLNTAPAAERQLLASMYTQLAELDQLNKEENSLATRLAILQFNPALSAAERNQLMMTVADLDATNALIVLISRQLIEQYRQLGDKYRLRAEELPQARRLTSEWSAAMRETYGTCAKPELIADLEPRLG